MFHRMMNISCAGGHDNCVKLWNLEISDLAVSLDGHKAPVTCVALSSDDSFALSGSEDTTVKAWSIVMGCVITDYTVNSYLSNN